MSNISRLTRVLSHWFKKARWLGQKDKKSNKQSPYHYVSVLQHQMTKNIHMNLKILWKQWWNCLRKGQCKIRQVKLCVVFNLFKNFIIFSQDIIINTFHFNILFGCFALLCWIAAKFFLFLSLKRLAILQAVVQALRDRKSVV